MSFNHHNVTNQHNIFKCFFYLNIYSTSSTIGKPYMYMPVEIIQ